MFQEGLKQGIGGDKLTPEERSEIAKKQPKPDGKNLKVPSQAYPHILACQFRCCSFRCKRHLSNASIISHLFLYSSIRQSE